MELSVWQGSEYTPELSIKRFFNYYLAASWPALGPSNGYFVKDMIWETKSLKTIWFDKNLLLSDICFYAFSYRYC